MEITGKIIVALPEQSGVSKAGNTWKKKEYVLETQETYPKKVHFDLFGDKADKYPLSVGQTVRLSFDIESREYNGRWFTSIRGWQAEPVDDAMAAAPAAAPAYPSAAPGGAAVPPPPAVQPSDPTEDLPF
ncbi:MAG: DUF3127 domain-containing protein [Muribaculaceae bacterium]|nr:DUF3127 domain-containing protein [Muribaculaceae bacterium]